MSIYLRMLWVSFVSYLFTHLPDTLGCWMFWRGGWTQDLLLWLASVAYEWGEAKLHAEVFGLPNRLAAYRQWEAQR